MSASILVVDDSILALEKITRALEGSRLCNCIYQAQNGREGLEILKGTTVDLVICDLAMPELDGFGFLRTVRSSDSYRDLPIIMVTANDDLEAKIEGFELGASDFLVKPFADLELIARTRSHLQTKKRQDQLKKNNQLLQTLSRTDPLTGLRNRRGFTETLQREILRSRVSGAPLSLLMADLDHFKKINDAYGHPTGDEVLVAIASLLQGALREYDLAARYGGEEFAIVLPETGRSNAVKIAERLRQKVSALDLSRLGHPIRITTSLGVATYNIGTCRNIELLIDAADAALYEAKRAGRNRVKTQEGGALEHPGRRTEPGRASLFISNGSGEHS